MNEAFIALGGNLGDVQQSFIAARDELRRHRDIELLRSSKCYRTAPVGPAGQPDYLNAVIAVRTSLPPAKLLKVLQQIENSHGRRRSERWGARTLDLDILAYRRPSGDIHMQTDSLTIPHPMMHLRMFVLCPLCDLDPNWQHPLLKVTAAALMSQLIASGEAPLSEGVAW